MYTHSNHNESSNTWFLSYIQPFRYEIMATIYFGLNILGGMDKVDDR